MASKSRLGKGLGALFPTLPGEEPVAEQPAIAGKHTALHLLLFRRGHTCRQQTANHLAVLVEGAIWGTPPSVTRPRCRAA